MPMATAHAAASMARNRMGSGESSTATPIKPQSQPSPARVRKQHPPANPAGALHRLTRCIEPVIGREKVCFAEANVILCGLSSRYVGMGSFRRRCSSGPSTMRKPTLTEIISQRHNGREREQRRKTVPSRARASCSEQADFVDGAGQLPPIAMVAAGGASGRARRPARNSCVFAAPGTSVQVFPRRRANANRCLRHMSCQNARRIGLPGCWKLAASAR